MSGRAATASDGLDAATAEAADASTVESTGVAGEATAANVVGEEADRVQTTSYSAARFGAGFIAGMLASGLVGVAVGEFTLAVFFGFSLAVLLGFAAMEWT